MIKDIVVCIHGIRTRQMCNWLRIFKLHFEYDIRFKDWLYVPAKYGYLWAMASVIPFVKRSRIRWFIRYLRKLQKKYPNARLNIIAHSYGSLLANEAIKSGIQVNKFILVGGIVSSHMYYGFQLKDLVKEVHNFCSYNDKVVRFQPTFGHCGYLGFLREGSREHRLQPYLHLKVYNHRYEVKHSEYFNDSPPDFYKIFRDLLQNSFNF